MTDSTPPLARGPRRTCSSIGRGPCCTSVRQRMARTATTCASLWTWCAGLHVHKMFEVGDVRRSHAACHPNDGGSAQGHGWLAERLSEGARIVSAPSSIY